MGLIATGLSGGTAGSPVASATDPEREDPGEGGVTGFFGNALDELQDIAGGVGTLVGSVVGDVGRAAATVATAGQVDFNFKSDDILNAVTGGVLNVFNEKPGEGWDLGESVVLEDLGQRWGALAPGGRPASEFLSEVYKNPLSFLGDALTVATAGGYGAVKAAAVAGKIGKVGGAARAAGAASVVDELGLLGKGALASDDLGRAATFVKAVQGSSTKYINPITRKVEFFDAMKNPVKRKLFQEPALKLLMERGEKGSQLAERLASEAINAGPEAMGKFQRALEIRRMADAAIAGDTPVLRTWAGRKLTHRAVDTLVGGVKSSSRQYADDLVRTLEQADVLGKLPDAVDPDDVADILRGLDGTHVNDGYTPRDGRGRRATEAFDDIGPRSRGELVGWKTPQGADEVEVGTSILQEAESALTELVPALRDEFGPGTVTGRVKDTASLSRKASAAGTVRAAEDALGIRIVLDDAWSGADLNALEARVAKATGGEVKRIDNSIAMPGEMGDRSLTFVVERNGNPIEVQVMTPLAAETMDATTNLRAHIAGLERKLIEDPDSPDAESWKWELEAARRQSHQLWEGVTADLREKLGGHADSEMRKRANRARIAVWRDLSEPAIEMGLPVRSMFENSYMGQRYLNGASFNDITGETEGISAFDLDDMNADAGDMAPVYVPMMDVRRMPKRGDFLLNSMPQGLRAVNDRNLEKNTGYLFAKGLESKDYRTVYRIRAKRAQRAMESHMMTQAVLGQYSRRVTDWTQKSDDEVLWSPDVLNAMYRTERGSDDAIMDAMEAGTDPEGSIGDVLERAQVSQQELLRRVAENQDVEVYAIPSAVAKRLKDHAKVWGGSETLDAAWGAPTALWKNMVLAGSPRWILNNVVGNSVFLKLQGGKLSDVVRQLNPKFRKRIEEAMGPQVERATGSGFFDELAKDPRKYDDEVMAGAIANRIQQSAAVNKAAWLPRKWSDFAHRVNGGVEDAFRRASYINAADRAALRAESALVTKSFWTSKTTLDRVYRHGLDPQRAGKAIDEMNKFMNDYSAMSPTGRNIIRPYIAPFWGFYRHAARMVLTLPFEHPGKAKLLQAINEVQEREVDKLGALPSWLQDQLPLGPAASAGDYRFMSTAGLNPFNAFFENPTNSFHPFWKMAFEQSSGRSAFSQKPFTDPNVIKAYGSDQQYRIDPETGETVPVDKVAPGFLQHLMMQVPQYDLAKDLIAGGSTYDTSGLLDAAAGEAVITDPETGSPLYPKDRLLQLARLFGYTESQYDIDSFTEKRQDETEQALKVWLERNPDAAEELGL